MTGKLKISAQNISPIRSLDAQLSDKKENLIFAPNGTGKTFLARALRCLGFHRQDKDINQIASEIISEEADSGSFSISYKEEKDTLAVTRGNAPDVALSNHIFHVFSETFIHEELRERNYTIKGEIEGNIALDIGSDFNKLKEARAAYKEAEKQEQDNFNKLQTAFEDEEEKELRAKANVHRSLGTYKNLGLDTAFVKYYDKSFDVSQKLK